MQDEDFLGDTDLMSVPPVECVRANVRGTLTVLSGPALGSVITLPAAEIFIGRSAEAKLRLEDDRVSRCHARVRPSRDGYLIEDFGSTNGTFVEGRRIAAPVELRDGARIQIGKTLLQFGVKDDLEQIAAQRVYEMGVRDGLTGLHNRRYFEERLRGEFAFAIRHKTPLGAIMIDVDHFKQVNDRFGHQGGDAVLRAVGRALSGRVRAEDLLARYGGEELVLLVPGIPAADTRALAERLRVLIQGLRVPLPEGTCRITASFGVAHNAFPVSHAAQLVAAADAALYRAKRRGRNRVEGPVAVGQYSLGQKRQRGANHNQTTEVELP